MGLHLPRWVWIGAVLLACVAGMVNVIGYLGFEHQAVSHLTGTTSLLGAAIAHGDLRSVIHLWGVLIAVPDMGEAGSSFATGPQQVIEAVMSSFGATLYLLVVSAAIFEME